MNEDIIEPSWNIWPNSVSKITGRRELLKINFITCSVGHAYWRNHYVRCIKNWYFWKFSWSGSRNFGIRPRWTISNWPFWSAPAAGLHWKLALDSRPKSWAQSDSEPIIWWTSFRDQYRCTNTFDPLIEVAYLVSQGKRQDICKRFALILQGST